VTDVFVDTAGWAAWVNPRDADHAGAKALFDRYLSEGRTLVTTSAVLGELTALLTSRKLSKERQIQVFDGIVTDPSVEIVFVDRELDTAAWTLWRSHRDKDWTFVDCVGFVEMRRRGLTDALTTDHHFEQAGFVRLLN
jgi:predicted nucleic acid-binding protein